VPRAAVAGLKVGAVRFPVIGERAPQLRPVGSEQAEADDCDPAMARQVRYPPQQLSFYRGSGDLRGGEGFQAVARGFGGPAVRESLPAVIASPMISPADPPYPGPFGAVDVHQRRNANQNESTTAIVASVLQS